jgi:hypothetical protein
LPHRDSRGVERRRGSTFGGQKCDSR